MRVVITGGSDDLCDVSGDLAEEFCNDASGDPFVLAFGDGSVVEVRYDDEGIWKVRRLREGTAVFRLAYEADAGSEDRGEGYTDRAILEGDLQWVRELTPAEVERLGA